MAKSEEIPRTNPAEIENLSGQIRGTNLDSGAKAVGCLWRAMGGADVFVAGPFKRQGSSFRTRRTSVYGYRWQILTAACRKSAGSGWRMYLRVARHWSRRALRSPKAAGIVVCIFASGERISTEGENREVNSKTHAASPKGHQ
jgi:hypothetical protein